VEITSSDYSNNFIKIVCTMKKRINVLMIILSVSLTASAQTVEKGPYTVYTIGKNVYHIEDANSAYPAGLHTDMDGKTTGMNNCSDMYLVAGKEKALLVDLSNFIRWDSTAVESLRSIVYDRTGDRELLITVTHWHGDHTGMLPAFKDDPKARFWIPGEEFKGRDLFPKERTIFFPVAAMLLPQRRSPGIPITALFSS